MSDMQFSLAAGVALRLCHLWHQIQAAPDNATETPEFNALCDLRDEGFAAIRSGDVAQMRAMLAKTRATPKALMPSDIVQRRGGPGFNYPCNDPQTVECALWDCQVIGRCRKQTEGLNEARDGAPQGDSPRGANTKD